MKTYSKLLTAAAVLTLAASSSFAGNTYAPGQVAKNWGVDLNDDGKANGKDAAPGQLTETFPGWDRNGDGKVNGKDHAPGKNK